MELEISETEILKEIFNCLSNYNDEVNIKFTEIGLSVNCIDRSNIAIIRVKLLRFAFTKFEFKENETITLNLNELTKFLKKVKKDDVLNIKTDEEKIIISINKNKRFSITLLDEIDESFKDDKEVDFDVEIDINKDEMIEYITDLSDIGEGSVKFKLKEKRLILSKGDFKSKGEIILKKDIDYYDKEIISKYTDTYIINFNNIMKIGSSLKIRLKEDSPIQIISELKNFFKAEFILAPMVTND